MNAQKQSTDRHPIGSFLSVNQRAFIVYIRTRQFMKTRLKGIDESEAVHVSQNEIAERFFPYPKYNVKNELQQLVNTGQLRITENKTVAGHTMFNYEVLQPGKIDLYLIKPKPGKFDSDALQMIEHLKRVTVDQGAPELPPYFDSFLKFRDDCMNLFVSVCEFAGRMHTPVTNLHRPIRPYLLIDGMPTIGIDVTTMQPLLLGKILKQAIGANEYSTWIEEGEDIYIKLQQKAGLETRDQGKKRFFEILFARPNNELAEMFGGANWITWINQYKTKTEPNNPHNKEKPFSNVAWLLQTTEVRLMRKVWHQLIKAGIPFLSVHDEIIVKQSDRHQAEQLFRLVMDQEFSFYKLNVKQTIIGTKSEAQPIPHPQPENQPYSHEIRFIPPQPANTKHDFVGADGYLHTHYPGLPELIN